MGYEYLIAGFEDSALSERVQTSEEQRQAVAGFAAPKERRSHNHGVVGGRCHSGPQGRAQPQ